MPASASLLTTLRLPVLSTSPYLPLPPTYSLMEVMMTVSLLWRGGRDLLPLPHLSRRQGSGQDEGRAGQAFPSMAGWTVETDGWTKDRQDRQMKRQPYLKIVA